MTTMWRAGLASLGLLSMGLLAGCNESTATPGAAAEDMPAKARRVAEERLRANLPAGTAAFRWVQAHPQAIERSYAVCGQVTADRARSPYVPFVAVVAFDAEAPRVESFVANTGQEATRVYVEMTARCGEGGGPAPGTRMAAPALPPPLPRGSALVEANGPAQAPAAEVIPVAAQAPSPAQASGSVTVASATNLRQSPGGGGAVMRVVPGGTAMKVFDRAPGGWLQVGGTEPEGWVHGSRVN